MSYINKNRAGYQRTKLGWIPDDWRIVRLSEVSTIDSESLKNGTELDYTFRYITLSSISEGKKVEDFVQHKFSSAPSRARMIVKNGDVLLASVRPNLLGHFIIEEASNNLICSTGFSVIRVGENLHSRYLFSYLFSSLAKSQYHSLVVGSNYPALTSSDVRNFKIVIPSIVEQRKIAQILTTWDKTNEKTEQLIEAKTQLKKGLMQQLLTGKKRFIEFEGENWSEYVLGNLGKTFNGLSGKNKNDFGSGNPYIPYLNIINNSKIDPNQMDLVTVKDGERQNTVKYGDIFFTTSSETPEEAGMPSVLLDKVENTYLNSFCFGFRLNDFETLDPEFARFYFRSYLIRKEIFRLAQGSTRYNISKNEVIKIKILLPSIKEQQRIAIVLANLEEQIDTLKRNSLLLQEQKKGLMQKLLTGEVRVKTYLN